IADNDMVIDYASGNSPIAAIRGYLQQGRASGDWSGNGLTSGKAHDAAGVPGGVTKALGYAEASTLGIVGSGTLDGTQVDDSSLLIMYTISGDATMDRRVNALDFNALASNYGATSDAVWTAGDFNFDGMVDTNDFTEISRNFNASLTVPSPSAALGTLVPEP